MTFVMLHERRRHTGVAVASAISGVFGWIGRQLDRRRVRLALLELSDEQLKDIGLSRGEAYGLSSSRAYAEELRRLGG
jgi:uncharacterized protein YjiS (DUF1127 family)